jgi:hypothetical protein
VGAAADHRERRLRSRGPARVPSRHQARLPQRPHSRPLQPRMADRGQQRPQRRLPGPGGRAAGARPDRDGYRGAARGPAGAGAAMMTPAIRPPRLR